MARLIRPLRHWPTVPHYRHFPVNFTHLLSPSPPFIECASKHLFFFATAATSQERHRKRPGGLKLPNVSPPSDLQESELSDSDSDTKKSRNQKKREARRAVRWAMEIASFSTPQIKRILRVASLEQEVLEALMLVKRLGPDVREGKRRQYSYIGKLLREAEPELMDALIQATKLGDTKTLQSLAASRVQTLEEEVENDNELVEFDYSDEDENSECINIASRWFDGLINKDTEITKEVYSVNSIGFDRQELRRLVRRVHTAQEQLSTMEENRAKADAAMTSANKSLTRFLCVLAKQLPDE